MTPCNNTSVGILVTRNGRLLLIERRKPPYGWAPPAGHVDPGETYPEAAVRELREEVGLRVTDLRFLDRTHQTNRCHRPGGDWHQWEVYEATTEGDPVRSDDETRAMRWATHDDLRALTRITQGHLTMCSGPNEWQANPGLEPVWLTILTRLGKAPQ